MPMHRYALLIGCNRGHNLPTLKGAERDVIRMRELLQRHPVGWGDAERIITLPGDVTPKKVDDAIRSLLAKLTGEDFVFIHYAGHAQTRGNQAVLVLPGHEYPIQRLTDAFLTHRTSPVRGALMLLDCCYSDSAPVSAFHSFLQELFQHARQHGVRATDSARAVFAVANAAWEDERGGYLTSAFIEGCESGGAALNATNDGIVDVDSLKRFLGNTLKQRSHREEFTGVSFGVFDIKTRLEWRLKKGGSRVYKPQTFIMLPEQTALWHPSERMPHKLVSAYWTGSPLTIAVGYEGQDVTLLRLDATSGTFIEQRRFPVKSARMGIKLSPDARYLAVRPDEAYQQSLLGILIFDIETGQHIKTVDVTANQHFLTSNNLLVTCGARDGILEVWPFRTSRTEPIADGTAHQPYPVNHLRGLGGDSQAVSAGQDGQVFIWDLSEVQERLHKKREMAAQRLECDALAISEAVGFGQAMRVAVNRDATLVAAGYGGVGRVRTWRLDNPLCPLDVGRLNHEHGNYISALEFSGDGHWLASGCGGGKVYLSALTTNAPPKFVWAANVAGHDERISSLAFAPQEYAPTLVIGTAMGRVLLYQIETGKHVELMDPYQRGEVYRIALLGQHNFPMRIIIAAQAGIEGWNFSWDEAP